VALPLHTVNAYRRLSPGNWAPRTATWSLQNYSTAIRAVTDSADLCRLEFRLPGADVHPHLGLAMFLGAGLWGIEKRIAPPVPVISDGRVDVPVGTKALPRDLFGAARALSNSKVAAELFGETFVGRFAESRQHEYHALQRAVSVAEKARYFEAM
jgi:glutamine synthetase